MARIIRHLNTDWLNFRSRCSMEYPILVNTTDYCNVSSPFETYNHIGRDDYYLIYMVEGELSLDMQGINRTIKKGDALLIPPKHVYKYSGDNDTRYLYAHFTGSYAADFLKECGLDNLPCVIEGDFRVEIERTFKLMIDTFLHNEKLATQKCACLIQCILIDIYKNSLEKEYSSYLQASMEYIRKYFTKKISIPHLAKLESLSNSRYITVFKRLMGKSPNEYIISLRMNFAKNLLDNTNISIQQISERVGYSDQYFFSRLFKKYLGISPQNYRKMEK